MSPLLATCNTTCITVSNWILLYCIKCFLIKEKKDINPFTKLQQRCFDVVSTLCKVENPTSDFVSFSTLDQRHFNAELQLWNNVDSRLKFWLGRKKTQHQLTTQIKWRFIHIFMPWFAFAEFIKSMSHLKGTLKQIWKSPYIFVSIKNDNLEILHS